MRNVVVSCESADSWKPNSPALLAMALTVRVRAFVAAACLLALSPGRGLL